MKSQWMSRDKFRSTFWIIFTTSILHLFGCSATVPFEKRIPLLRDSIQIRCKELFLGISQDELQKKIHGRTIDSSFPNSMSSLATENWAP
jgi:hypothetical protein